MSSPNISATLLGFTVSERLISDVLSRDSNLPLQTHKFAWSLARAMREGGADVELLSAVPVSSYPLMPKVIFRSERFSQEGFFGRTLGFVNLVGIKHVTRALACWFVGLKEINRHKTNVIVVHGVHSPFLWSAVFFSTAVSKGCGRTY